MKELQNRRLDISRINAPVSRYTNNQAPKLPKLKNWTPEIEIHLLTSLCHNVLDGAMTIIAAMIVVCYKFSAINYVQL